MEREKQKPARPPGDFLKHCLAFIAADAARRLQPVSTMLAFVPLLAAIAPRKASAANTVPFTPVPTLTPDQAHSVDQEGGDFDLANWVDRGMTIRSGENVYQCLANLTAALDLVGQLNSAEYNGSAGALSLLPTAGALLGAPTREMWIVYKLVPMAGVLSMFLSLGGSITPSNVGDYDPEEPFSYGGFMPTTRMTTASLPPPPSRGTSINALKVEAEEGISAAKRFAHDVKQRADDDAGGSLFLGIWIAMVMQVALIIVLLIPMWYAQQGSVIPWWCRVWGWMYFWYFLVTVVAVFDNLVAAPFSRSWTVRVSRMPTGLIMDGTIRKITERSERFPNALECIKAGPNTNQRIRIDEAVGSAYSRTCFYVVISVHGISALHAVAQVVGKTCSVAVFAFGTALFASATMMSMSVALMVLCLLLPCGVAGRVIAMWIVAQMSTQNRPILHKVVRSEKEAGEYIHAIAELDLQIEIRGHVILNGSCVKSRHTWFAPSTYIGLLAKPYDVIALAERNTFKRFSVAQPGGIWGNMTSGRQSSQPAAFSAATFQGGNGNGSYFEKDRTVAGSSSQYQGTDVGNGQQQQQGFWQHNLGETQMGYGQGGQGEMQIQMIGSRSESGATTTGHQPLQG